MYAAPSLHPTDSLPSGLAAHPDYEVASELGRGGIGVAYLAQNTLLDRKEVLMVVSGQLLGEIRNAARLHHPNIVNAYSAFRCGENLVLAMEYVEGLILAKLVKAKGPLPLTHACYFIQQAALGLQHGHAHGMIHGDVEPANLILAVVDDRAVVKILNFGLAKVRSKWAVASGLTHESQMLGMPDCVAREQIGEASRTDIRADIYSLGCTLYYILTGDPPFQGKSSYDILQAHRSTEATPLNLVRPEVPAELAVVVAKMMAKDPERRFREQLIAKMFVGAKDDL